MFLAMLSLSSFADEWLINDGVACIADDNPIRVTVVVLSCFAIFLFFSLLGRHVQSSLPTNMKRTAPTNLPSEKFTEIVKSSG
jgi:hypothetical protein